MRRHSSEFDWDEQTGSSALSCISCPEHHSSSVLVQIHIPGMPRQGSAGGKWVRSQHGRTRTLTGTCVSPRQCTANSCQRFPAEREPTAYLSSLSFPFALKQGTTKTSTTRPQTPSFFIYRPPKRTPSQRGAPGHLKPGSFKPGNPSLASAGGDPACPAVHWSDAGWAAFPCFCSAAGAQVFT